MVSGQWLLWCHGQRRCLHFINGNLKGQYYPDEILTSWLSHSFATNHQHTTRTTLLVTEHVPLLPLCAESQVKTCHLWNICGLSWMGVSNNVNLSTKIYTNFTRRSGSAFLKPASRTSTTHCRRCKTLQDANDGSLLTSDFWSAHYHFQHSAYLVVPLCPYVAVCWNMLLPLCCVYIFVQHTLSGTRTVGFHLCQLVMGSLGEEGTITAKSSLIEAHVTREHPQLFFTHAKKKAKDFKPDV